MSLRSSTIYVEPRTVKRLHLVRKLYPQLTRLDASNLEGSARDKTVDERADELLNQGIEAMYPRVLDLEKELAQVEKRFMKELAK